jgi:hypothetical protein
MTGKVNDTTADDMTDRDNATTSTDSNHGTRTKTAHADDDNTLLLSVLAHVTFPSDTNAAVHEGATPQLPFSLVTFSPDTISPPGGDDTVHEGAPTRSSTRARKPPGASCSSRRP